MRQATKLAWANTSDDLRRLLVRCAGITFAVVLMFMQVGFRNALFDSNVRIAEMTSADFVVRTKTRFMLSSGQLMPAEKIILARNVAGVAEVQPIYIETIVSYLRRIGHSARRLRVIAFDPRCPMFSELEISEFAEPLNAPQVAIADRKSKSDFKFNQETCAAVGQTYGELAGKKISLVGCFKLGIDFSNDGNLIMTPENFAHYFPFRGNRQPLSMVDYGMIRCRENADQDQVLQDLKRELGPHVIVNTKAEFLDSERDFWANSTPIGLIFRVGLIIGFVVGLIICYQVLATDIGDHMGEFATIKAMGYPSGFFAAVVVIQAVFLSLISFVPGMLITLAIFSFVNNFSGLIMFLDFDRASQILLLTVGMCVLSGIVALKKLLSTDPANLF